MSRTDLIPPKNSAPPRFCMLRLARKTLWLGFLLAGSVCSFGFALLGPINEAYEVAEDGFNPDPNIDLAPTAPKNLGQEYRRNTPVLYYACDSSFLDYFGSNGLAAIDQAAAAINAVGSVSDYSPDLKEFSLDTRRMNYTARGLGLYDVKSVAMRIFLENLGLAEPARYTWIIRNWYHQSTGNPPPSPAFDFFEITMRNFDPTIVTNSASQSKYSAYVNGTLLHLLYL